jgi:glycosyltransferase involved in cell wall biosynthesis
MRILIPGETDITDGVSTYIEDLVTVLRDREHFVYNNREPEAGNKDFVHKAVEDFDIAITKGPYNYKCPVIIHEHAAVIPSIRYDMYKGWTQTKGRIVTVNSEFQRLQLLKAGVESSKIKWLPNCVDEKVFYPRDVRVMTKKILYLGRAGQNNENTFLTLLKAMERLTDFFLTIAGSVDNYIRKQLDKYDLSRVSFLGEVPNPDILAEIISMHSFGVGVGRASMEMSLCGLPVMVFGQGWEGWINERNAETLHRQANMTTRMSERISQKEKINRFCSAIYSAVPLNREKAVEVFGLRKNIYIYEALFKELINENLQDCISGGDSSIGISRV